MWRAGMLLALHGAILGAWAAPLLQLTVQLDQRRPLSMQLFGLFFEEINHAGEGGLLAELVQDRSFDALYLTHRHRDISDLLALTPAAALQPRLGAARGAGGRASTQRDCPANDDTCPTDPAGSPEPLSALEKLRATSWGPGDVGLGGQPVAWRTLPQTIVRFSASQPLFPNNPVALEVRALAPLGGVYNTGFWGVPVARGRRLHLSLWARLPQGAANSSQEALALSVSLQAADFSASYANRTLHVQPGGWAFLEAELEPSASDTGAVLALQLLAAGRVVLDQVSLFPAENVARGSAAQPWPFRQDILEALAALQPRFLRFPGGCYVEGGARLANRFDWRATLGRPANRTGHLNANWGYWSTDGLGLHEYLQLAEALGAAPVWVVNSGNSHATQIGPAQLPHQIQDVLDSLEFILGAANSTWGQYRARLGRAEPWPLQFVAVGNENCPSQGYERNFEAIAAAVHAAYPFMRVIANCVLDRGENLVDYHNYSPPDTLWGLRHMFDELKDGLAVKVFVSEYAAHTGEPHEGQSTLRHAVAEAGFMTGLERNSWKAPLASYAPLLAHAQDSLWVPTLLVHNNSAVYHTPSSLVQQLFAAHRGFLHLETAIACPGCPPGGATGPPREQGGPLEDEEEGEEEGSVQLPFSTDWLAGSTTCQDLACSQLSVKVVNYAPFQQNLSLAFNGSSPQSPSPAVEVTTLVGPSTAAKNSFENPHNVALLKEEVTYPPSGIAFLMPAMSVVVLNVSMHAAF